jgi:hypothetical protein
MRIRLLSIALVSVLTAARAEAQFNVPDPAPGEQFHVELGLMFWSPTPDIRIQTGGLAAMGVAEVDFVREFELENERFNEFRAVIKAGRKHKIRFSYVPFTYDKQAILQRTISFGGVTIPVSVPADAHLKWDLWRIGYEWDFVAADRGVVGLITELKHNEFRAELSATGFGSEVTEVTAPIVAIGGIARVYPHKHFSITAEFTGFKVFGFIRSVTDAIAEDLDAKMYDLDVYGTINFGTHVGIQGGYRSVTAEYSLDDDTGDLTMKGLYFGALVRF